MRCKRAGCREQATPSGANKFCYKCAVIEYGKDKDGWPLIPCDDPFDKSGSIWAIRMYMVWLLAGFIGSSVIAVSM